MDATYELFPSVQVVCVAHVRERIRVQILVTRS